MAAVAQPMEEEFCLGNKVRWFGGQGIVLGDHTYNGAFDYAWCMAAREGQVEVEVLRFFEDLSGETARFNGDCEVHEVNRGRAIFKVREPKVFIDCLKRDRVVGSVAVSVVYHMAKESSMYLL